MHIASGQEYTKHYLRSENVLPALFWGSLSIPDYVLEYDISYSKLNACNVFKVLWLCSQTPLWTF